MERTYDCSGWATRNDIRCADGRTIRKDAFKDCDGKTVPLVWMHGHDSVSNVLGHALLENRDEGVYAYVTFNDTPQGEDAKLAVKNKDLTHFSIYANKLSEKNGDVLHGKIREVSLVLSGANPGALIDVNSVAHSEDGEYEAEIFVDDEFGIMMHAEKDEEEPKKEPEEKKDEEKKEESDIDKLLEGFTDEQKDILYLIVGQIVADKEKKEGDEAKHSDIDGGNEMKHNVFDKTTEENDGTLMHVDIDFDDVMKDFKKEGSIKAAFLAHAEDYGVDGVEWLFPEARELNNTPEFIKRDMEWVQTVMNGVHHTPFSRVKTRYADITEDEARARGYIKGKLKKEEVFSLLKRTTTPTTVYKKQKMDRDDIVDITDFDVVSWIKGEMRLMLNEELARAYLIGDGRLASDDDKIPEDHIRPIVNDADLFTIKKAVVFEVDATDDEKAKAVIRAAVKARKDYKGSGNPTLFTTEDWLTNMLLLEDGIGHRMYKTEAELATAMRVSKIVTVPVMENFQLDSKNLIGIIVNLADYNVGADKGGAINMFEDFDIDYNQEKYLIETRCSGALVKPFSAIVLWEASAPTSVDGGVQRSKTTYTEADLAGTENPKALGLYELNEADKYVKTTDTSVVQDKTYFVRTSFNAD